MMMVKVMVLLLLVMQLHLHEETKEVKETVRLDDRYGNTCKEIDELICDLLLLSTLRMW
ncbi:unnamed protein product, partial [Linum tenue]